MSNMAKSARAAMKAKAKRLGEARSAGKVSSSDWTPPEELNADVKTGMRPVSRRAFKKGGKVMGDCNAPRADRKPRKSGGKAEYKAEATEFANAKVNRNVKAANEQREGKKHVGGMNRGGSTYGVPDKLRLLKTHTEGDNTAKVYKNASTGEHQVKFFKDGVHQKKADYFTDDPSDAHDTAKYALDRGFKRGGRAKKQAGGSSDAIGEYLDKNPAPARAPEKSVPLPPPRPKNLDKPKEPQADITDPKNWPSTINSHRKSGGKVDKKTGRTKKMMGGPMMNPGQMMAGITPAAMGGGNMPQSGGMTGPDPRMGMVSPKSMEFGQNVVTPGLKKGGRVSAESEDYKALRQKGGTQVMKKGGKASRTDKAGGGLAEGMKRLISRGSQMPRPSISQEDKEADALREQGRGVKRLLGQMPRAKGGKAAHPDEAMDKALIKKMVKPEARKGKNIGGMLGGLIPMALGAMGGKDKDEKKHGGRTARKAGGRTKAKGKTNINIMISAGKPEAPGIGPMDMPPPPMGGPGAAPVPVPAPKAPGPQAAPMPMPIPMPMPMPGAAPGGPPMPRKAGGRVSKVAKSYKDMEAGAGSGEGRLQKTDIAKRQPKPGFQKGDNVFEGQGYPNKVPGATGGRTAKKKGGKVYKSYKDMDAGAGSGVGRLEKTEIASRHH